MPLFHTTLFSNDPPGAAFHSAGAAWSFEKCSGVYAGPPNGIHKRSTEIFKERGHGPTINDTWQNVAPFFDMEVLIRAHELSKAKQALNLLISSVAVLEGSIAFCPEALSIEPWEVGAISNAKSYMSLFGVLDACKLANRASRKRSLSYAVHKLALSYRSCSPHMMDLDPNESPRKFGIHVDPVYHVYLANAITLAYSAIEELGIQIRASEKNPSKMPDGTWNPKVKEKLEVRLRESGIDISTPLIWTLRGPKTRIEKSRPPPTTGKPSWSHGIVRDINIQIIDALALASWLRSSTTTHAFPKRARSLTVYDAHNVQSLARFLITQSSACVRIDE